MAAESSYTGASGATSTVIDVEALGTQITKLETLYNSWVDKSETAPDVGECGGSTIIQIEAMTEMFQNMQDAFVLLMNNTLLYMTNRKESIETKEDKATNKVESSN